jgi:hypothetical protein
VSDCLPLTSRLSLSARREVLQCGACPFPPSLSACVSSRCCAVASVRP